MILVTSISIGTVVRSWPPIGRLPCRVLNGSILLSASLWPDAQAQGATLRPSKVMSSKSSNNFIFVSSHNRDISISCDIYLIVVCAVGECYMLVLKVG